jgi:hypothetical protein
MKDDIKNAVVVLGILYLISKSQPQPPPGGTSAKITSFTLNKV